MHAPAGADGPGIDAQGASFVGINLYVQLGRGRDYAWSATSAGQDIIDTFALELCDDTPLPLPRHVRADRGAREDQPLGADARRPDRARLADAEGRADEARPRRRPRRGPRQAGDLHQAALDLLPRGRLRRRLHGLQHARGASRTPRPSSAPRRRSATRSTGSTPTPSTSRTSTRARTRCGRGASTTTSRSPAQVRVDATGTRTRGRRASRRSTRTRRRSTRPTSSTGTTSRRAATAPPTRTRTRPPTARCCSMTASRRGSRARKMTLPSSIDAMEVAGHAATCAATSTCRWRCGCSEAGGPGAARGGRKLRAWRRDGAHRRDANDDGVYEHADAIRIMDAWWPLLGRGAVQAALGRRRSTR